MKIKSLIILFFIPTSVLAQQTKDWINMLENPKIAEYYLSKENQKTAYLKYDFSTLLVPRTEFLGYIGMDFHRLMIFFTSVTKDSANPENYKIYGVSLVGTNKCDFMGILSIEQIREYKAMHYGLDNEFESKGLKSQGILIGKFELKENPNQDHCGRFQGIMTLNWYLDNLDIIHYDNIECYSDNYRNNQYVGVWTEYKSNEMKCSNWGERRIPFSVDLDIGAGEFSPNPIYFDKGWNDFKIE